MSELLNDAVADVQIPLPEVTVYDVPTVIPLTNPVESTVGPVGIKV